MLLLVHRVSPVRDVQRLERVETHRVKMPSKRESVAASAGTNEPIWARRAMRAMLRERDDLPASDDESARR